MCVKQICAYLHCKTWCFAKGQGKEHDFEVIVFLPCHESLQKYLFFTTCHCHHYFFQTLLLYVFNENKAYLNCSTALNMLLRSKVSTLCKPFLLVPQVMPSTKKRIWAEPTALIDDCKSCPSFLPSHFNMPALNDCFPDSCDEETTGVSEADQIGMKTDLINYFSLTVSTKS